MNFLFFIGSVFAPMIAILIAGFFILKTDAGLKSLEMKNLFFCFRKIIISEIREKIDSLGAALYRYFIREELRTKKRRFRRS